MSKAFKFCILAAGRGSRNESLKGLHKALLPVGNRATISIIIEKVDKSVPIVIALGHQANQIRTYLEYVHSDRTLEFVYVENYQGPGAGPGLSLLKCEKNLQCPFIFTSADTIVDEEILFSGVKKNWAGVSQVSNSESHEYCLVKVRGKLIENFFYGNNEQAHAFTGIGGVHEFKKFWNGLRQKNVIRGEHQVLDGLRALSDLHRYNMSWLDTGNTRSYSRTKLYYPNDVAIEKDNEAIFIDNGHVVKYFEDSSRATKRVLRSAELGKGAPPITKINDNMFGYRYVEAHTLSEVYSKKVFLDFLEDYKKTFRTIKYEKDEEFIENCRKMYREKTFSRIESFVGDSLDNIKVINGIHVKPIEDLLAMIDWDSVYLKAIPSRFHGDMQPENILILSDNSYLYIDWRESFGESLNKGDAYYDLGKLYHALEISNNLILNGNYEVDFSEDYAEIQYTLKNNLYEFSETLKDFCYTNKYDFGHVRLLGILNYLNIASLYDKFEDGKYGKFLFLLGKKLLTQHLEKNNG